MKIFTKGAVYVQKNDMGFLNQMDHAMPTSVFLEVFGKGVTIIDDSNRFDFVKFKLEREIEFFRRLDFILDYDLVKDLDEDKLIELGMSVAEEKNNLVRRYNLMSKEERSRNRDIFDKCEMLDFKMYSIRDFLWFKQGHIKFDLPKGIECQNTCGTKNKSGLLKKILSKRKEK